VIYTRRASALHSARPLIAAFYGAALITLALAFQHPVVLGGVACATLAAAALAGVGPQVARLARFSLPLALLIAITNAIVVREGLTVLVRFGEIPPFGQVDVTLEALAYGLLLALRVVVVVLPFALVAATVDPDVVLRGMRRMSFRSALTAALATRMIPVLTRDARRMDEARRCRPGADTDGLAGRLAVVRAVTAGALDRAVDVAATLELRGFANARCAPHEAGPPLSRHDASVAISAAALLVLCAAGLAAGVATVDPYPTFELSSGAGPWLYAAAIVALALIPFASRRGIEP
jgi:energy-coupling factor transport system permease protein